MKAALAWWSAAAGSSNGELAADRRRGSGVGERGEHAESSTRQTLERIIRACATASCDESEFIQRLRDEGIRYGPRYAESSH